MTAEITPEGTAALSVRIDASLSATEVEDLIRDLAMARQHMTPAVPEGQAALPQALSRRLLEDAPASALELPDSAGNVVWNLRSAGLGWIGWRLTPGDVNGWVEYLATHYQQHLAAMGRQQQQGH